MEEEGGFFGEVDASFFEPEEKKRNKKACDVPNEKPKIVNPMAQFFLQRMFLFFST